jgi:methionine sulfoxide reductase heme-binding subunit
MILATRTDQWMSTPLAVKRQALCLLPLRLIGLVPLIFMAPALITLNTNTLQGSVADTLGTGSEINLLLCLSVTPLVLLTGWRWIVPLRRWYGITFAVSALTDATVASITTAFAGGVIGRLAGHTFLLIGLTMAVIALPLLLTANNQAQRKLGKYWKTLQKLTYVIWGLLFVHLALLEGLGFQSGANGSGFCGSETAATGACPSSTEQIFHQRFYQLAACSLILVVLRLPPVKRWVVAKQKEGRGWVPWAVLSPLTVLFAVGFAFIVNELIFKGTASFVLNPSNE